jgi:hypothetical protein
MASYLGKITVPNHESDKPKQGLFQSMKKYQDDSTEEAGLSAKHDAARAKREEQK